MYNEKTIAAVVPAYNEEGLIGRVIETLPAFVDRAYVIDDGSTDGTWAEIREHATAANERTGGGDAGEHAGSDPASVPGDTTDTAANGTGGATNGAEPDGDRSDRERARETPPLQPRVVPIKHARNQGVGAALKTGYRRALADGVDVTAVIAGDGQTEPDIVERIVAPVAAGEADYAKGNRLGPGDRDAMPRFRQVGNLALSFLTKVASGYWSVLDSQNGSTAISHEALSALDLDAVYEGYGYPNDMLVRLNARGMRVADVSRRAVYEDETSTISLRSYVPSVSALLLRGFGWRLRRKYLLEDTHPLVGLYALGAVATLAGCLGPLRDRFGGGEGRSSSGGVLGLGLLSLLLAMSADRAENRDLDFVVRREDHPAGTDAGTDTHRSGVEAPVADPPGEPTTDGTGPDDEPPAPVDAGSADSESR